MSQSFPSGDFTLPSKAVDAKLLNGVEIEGELMILWDPYGHITALMRPNADGTKTVFPVAGLASFTTD